MYRGKWVGFTLGILSILVVALFFYKPSTNLKEYSALKEPPILNKEYIALSESEIIPQPLPEETVSVIEFFSYHCHACYEIEKATRAWLKLQTGSIRFEQIPLKENDSLSEAIVRLHYLLHRLKKEMTATLFEWLHDKKDLTNPDIVRESVLKLGIDEADYEHVLDWKAGLDAQVVRGENLEKLYNIEEIPVFVIGGRYKTSPFMTDGNLLRFFEVMDALIEKVKKGKD